MAPGSDATTSKYTLRDYASAHHSSLLAMVEARHIQVPNDRKNTLSAAVSLYDCGVYEVDPQAGRHIDEVGRWWGSPAKDVKDWANRRGFVEVANRYHAIQLVLEKYVEDRKSGVPTTFPTFPVRENPPATDSGSPSPQVNPDLISPGRFPAALARRHCWW